MKKCYFLAACLQLTFGIGAHVATVTSIDRLVAAFRDNPKAAYKLYASNENALDLLFPRGPSWLQARYVNRLRTGLMCVHKGRQIGGGLILLHGVYYAAAPEIQGVITTTVQNSRYVLDVDKASFGKPIIFLPFSVPISVESSQVER